MKNTTLIVILMLGLLTQYSCKKDADHKSLNCSSSINDVLGDYLSTPLGPCSSCSAPIPCSASDYTVHVINAANCDSITIQNVANLNISISARYAGSGGVFNAPVSTYQYGGVTYTVTVIGGIVFNGVQLTMQVAIMDPTSGGTVGCIYTIGGVKQ